MKSWLTFVINKFFVLFVFAIYLLAINASTTPRWIATLYDPSYPYLFNGVDFLFNKDPFLWGHPGSFVHWFHYLFLAIYSFINGINSATTLVEASEQILLLIGITNTIIYIITLYISFNILIKRFTPSITNIVFLSFFFTINTNEVINNTPETFLVLFSPIFVTILLVQSYSEEKIKYGFYLLGFISAILFSTKYTSIFLLASVFILIKPQYWLRIVVSFVISLIILFFPIHSHLYDSIEWVYRLITQPGFGYGIQSANSREFSYFIDFFLRSITYDKLWVLLLFLSSSIFFYDYKSILINTNKIQFISLLVLLVIAILIMAYKEMFRYFVPSKYLLVILLFVLVYNSKKVQNLSLKRMDIVGGILMFLAMTYLVQSQYTQISRFNKTETFSNQIENRFSSKHVAVIRMFTSSSQKFAIFFGSLYSNGNYIKSENDFYLMPFTGRYYADFNKWALIDKEKNVIKVIDIFDKNYDQIFFIGRKSATSIKYWEDNKKLNFKLVDSFNGEFLYEISLK